MMMTMKIVKQKNKQAKKQTKKQIFVSLWSNHKTSVDCSLKNY